MTTKRRKRKPRIRAVRAPKGMAYVMTANPYSDSAGQQQVLCRVSTDPITWLASRGKINIQQTEAARRYQRAYEVWAGQAGMAIDYERERVQTSGITQQLTDSQINAADVIKQAVKTLGRSDSYMVQLVCGEGWKVSDYVLRVHGQAEAHSRHSARWTRHFADVLTKLAIRWGLESRKAAC